VKLAMIEVQRWLDASGLASKLVLQVHDELVLEVPEGEVEAMRSELPRRMAGVIDLKVPLLAEVGVGPNWERAH
jgi:DNA polymerase-1